MQARSQLADDGACFVVCPDFGLLAKLRSEIILLRSIKIRYTSRLTGLSAARTVKVHAEELLLTDLLATSL